METHYVATLSLAFSAPPDDRVEAAIAAAIRASGAYAARLDGVEAGDINSVHVDVTVLQLAPRVSGREEREKYERRNDA